MTQPGDREAQQRVVEEELRGALAGANHRIERQDEELKRLREAYRKLDLAWKLAKSVIAERFGAATGNLIRQGIETQVERSSAGTPEEPG